MASVLAACAGPGEAAPEGVLEGTRAKGFELESLEGDLVSLGDYRGSIVLVNLWATWCQPCREEIPDLLAAYDEHKDAGFLVLGVNVEESVETVAPFVEEFGITYPVLMDKDAEILKAYRAQGLPMSFIVDRDGMIRVRHTGYLSEEQLQSYLAQLLP
jgi:peroxiredoxin